MKTLSNMLTGNASTSSHTNGSAKLNDKASHRPRKAIVRDTKQRAGAVLDAIARTLSTARRIFANDDAVAPSLMKTALQFFKTPTDSPASLPPELQLSTKILLTTLPSSGHFLLLPPSIRTYTPYIDGSAVTTTVLQPHLQDKLESWFKKATSDAQSALADWFSDLTAVRDVWEIRTHLLTWLKTADGLKSSEQHDFESIINSASQHQATVVWKAALDRIQTSFQTSLTSATAALETSNDHPYGMFAFVLSYTSSY